MGAALGSEANAAPVKISAGTEVVRVWKPGEHLFVKGELGLSTAQLDALAEWLEVNATNWVVALLDSAAGETYRTADGRTFTGIEAVNYALGQGLIGQTPFGQSVDPRTGERNACFFALFLKDRRFSYYGSDAQDRRGLGEDNWIGNLDAPAIRAMRNGGRIVDAVKDTIKNIENRLTARIEAERREVARRAAEEQANRARVQAEAENMVKAASADLALLQQRTTELSRGHPEMTGDLARFDAATYPASVVEAERLLSSGEYAKARELAGKAKTTISQQLRRLDQYAEDTSRLDELGGRYQALSQARYAGSARKSLEVAAENLKAARAEHARGDSAYVGHLAAAQEAVRAASAAMASAERAAQAALAVAALAGSTTLAGLGLIGLFLNRRRLKPKREAEKLHATWARGLREKTDALFALLDRRAKVVGSSAVEAGQRYDGETLPLCQRIIQDVDELFIMSACADRVMGQAQALLVARSLGGRFVNSFSRRRYRRVLRLLRDEPIVFKPAEGLELIVRGQRTERDRLLGDRASYEPFAMTFQQLMEAFNERAGRALANLDLVESSVVDCTRAVESAQTDTDAAAGGETDLAVAAKEDGLLRLDVVFTRLLPAARNEMAEALKQALKDPVGASRTRAAKAKQQSADAAKLVAGATAVRKESLPALGRHVQALAAQSVHAGWIGAQARRLSDAADQLADAALTESAATGVAAWQADWENLAQRAHKAVELDTRRRGETRQHLAKTEAAIAEARQRIGGALRLDPASCLREPGRDPSELMTKAGEHLAAALAGLERGDVDAAENALNAAADLARLAGEMAAAARHILTVQPETVRVLRGETDRLAGLVASHRSILQGIIERYATSVLRLGAGDPAHPNANGTVEDNITETESALATARDAVEQAETDFRAARLFQAAARWEQATGANAMAEHRLAEIAEKAKRLETAETTNAATIQTLLARLEECERLVAAPATMMPTVRLLEETKARFAIVRPRVGANRENPFGVAEQLEKVGTAVTEIADKARCDRDVFEEAERSVKAATVQMTGARRAAADAGAVSAPSSPAMRHALDRLDQLAEALGQATAALPQPHGDWVALDAEADRITNAAARITAELRGEIERARAASNALTAAASAIRLAGGWTGGLGVAIFGSPGADSLARARALLQVGDYAAALAMAETARRVAQAAVLAAEAEVRRRQAAEQARRAAERRARAMAEAARQARRSAWGGGGGFGGFGSGGGFGGGGFGGGSSWGSSGSGVGGSTFSSGSGARTSGW